VLKLLFKKFPALTLGLNGYLTTYKILELDFVFPSISHDATQVPNVFPNMFPKGSHSSLYPISFFALSFTLVTCLSSPKEKITTY